MNQTLPKTDWLIFDEVLTELEIKREVMIYPERYQDQVSVCRRKRAIKAMRDRGISFGSLTSLTPFTERHLRSILDSRNGGNPEPQELCTVQGQMESR